MAVPSGMLTITDKANDILQNWEAERANFLQVCPKEMLVHLPHPLSDEAQAMPAE